MTFLQSISHFGVSVTGSLLQTHYLKMEKS